jgi:hypothetical protein
MEIVDGARLAKALRAPRRDRSPGFARPHAVTLAACDAGGVGSVVGAGASIAHALHEDGIPLVIASQFPLSFAGSILLARELHAGYLEGDDPRSLLVNLRRQMRTQVGETHDWASIVAYAAFPPDFEVQMQRFRINQAKRRLEAAFHHADRMLLAAEPGEQRRTATRGVSRPPTEQEFLDQRARLYAARDGLKDRLQGVSANAENYGILASSDKRLAQILSRMMNADGPVEGAEDEARDRLVDSKNSYMEAFRLEPSQSWSIVQALALTAVLSGKDGHGPIQPDDWELARILSNKELENNERQQLAWAHANLVELYLLAPTLPKGAPVSQAKARTEAKKHMEHFTKVADLSWVEIHSTRRQLLRYPWFFAKLNPQLAKIGEFAKELADTLPPSRIYA